MPFFSIKVWKWREGGGCLTYMYVPANIDMPRRDKGRISHIVATLTLLTLFTYMCNYTFTGCVSLTFL